MKRAARRGPDANAALAQYRARAGRYDTELIPFEPIRTAAIARLQLQPGQCVLDVGCGTGLSFEAIEERVGSKGRIVGIELSPEMIARAAERVEAHGWKNVQLVCAPAHTARIEPMADAAMFHFVHDVVRNPKALDHVLAHLKPGSRVVAAGLQWASAWAWPINLFVMGAALYSVTSLEGLGHPWSLLTRRLSKVDVGHAMFGGVYIASGEFAPAVH